MMRKVVVRSVLFAMGVGSAMAVGGCLYGDVGEQQAAITASPQHTADEVQNNANVSASTAAMPAAHVNVPPQLRPGEAHVPGAVLDAVRVMPPIVDECVPECPPDLRYRRSLPAEPPPTR